MTRRDLETRVGEAFRRDDSLDDVTRERMLAELERKLDQRASTARPTILARRATLALVVVAAAAIVAILVLRGSDDAPPIVERPDVLEVHEGDRIHTSLDDRAHVTLVGPARMHVEEVAAEIRVRLDAGTMMGDYDHSRGGSFVVVTPDTVLRVVGTVFSVTTSASSTSVSVLEGRVQVENRGAIHMVSAGETWSSASVTSTAAPRVPPQGDAPPPAVEPPGVAATPTRNVSAPPPAPPVTANSGDTARALSGDTAEVLYARADDALRRKDVAGARIILDELASRFPDSRLAADALYELALQAVAGRDAAEAARRLDQLLAKQSSGPLIEPARWLRCRLDVDADREIEALGCLGSFRRDFAGSTHEAEAIALLAVITQNRSGCTAARPFLDYYLLKYPDGPFALDAVRRREWCEP